MTVDCGLVIVIVEVDVVIEVVVPPGNAVFIAKSVPVSLLVRVETDVVALGTIDEYIICVESVKFPAGAAILWVGARRKTASDKSDVEIDRALVVLTSTYSVCTIHTSWTEVHVSLL